MSFSCTKMVLWIDNGVFMCSKYKTSCWMNDFGFKLSFKLKHFLIQLFRCAKFSIRQIATHLQNESFSFKHNIEFVIWEFDPLGPFWAKFYPTQKNRIIPKMPLKLFLVRNSKVYASFFAVSLLRSGDVFALKQGKWRS